MADDFDPYYTWLGIPPEEQPADHYRLLGVRRFESNLDVINNAGDQRMAFLRTFQVGRRSALSQRLLNEMAAAKVCLLDPDRRKTYDEILKASQPTPVAPAPAYSPLSPVLIPSGHAPVARQLPVATRLPGPPDPVVAIHPFAAAARELHSPPVLPAKPQAERSGNYLDQVRALVRAAAHHARELSPLAAGAYGVLALGVLMIVSVGLLIGLRGNRQSRWVAVAASANSASTPSTPQPTGKTTSSLESPGPTKVEPTVPSSPSSTDASAELPAATPGTAASPIPITPIKSETPETEPVENPAASGTVGSPSPDPPPASSVSPPIAPAETVPAPAAVPLKVAATPLWSVYPGKFPRPRKARLSSLTKKLAEFAVPAKLLKVWPVPADAGLEIGDPLVLTAQSNVQCVCFSRDDQLLAVGTEKTLDIWDLNTKKRSSVVLPGPAVDVVFCDNDQKVAVACQGGVPLLVVSLKTKAIIKKIQSAQPEIHSLAAGDQWLAALGTSREIAIYDLRRATFHGTIVHQARLPFTSVHMKGNEVLALDRRSFTTWNARELKQLAEWSTPVLDFRPQPDDFDPQSSHFTQQENGTLSLYGFGSDAPLARIASPRGRFALVDVAGDRLLTSGPEDQLLLWNLDKLKESKRTLNPTQEIAALTGAPTTAGSASTPGSTVPKPTSTSEDGPLETVDAVTALEALRGLGVQQLPNDPHEITFLNLYGSKVTDADAKYITAFPKLQNLHADRMPITGRALRYFSRLTELKSLSLSGSKITDDDLAFLSRLSNLEMLMLGDTAITSKGVVHLKDLPKLHSLYLPQNMDRDLIPVVCNMKQLQHLHPTPPLMDDADLARLSALTQLKSIDLQQARLTLEGYQHLQKFQEMTNVILYYDCPREVLASLKNMKLSYFHFPQNARDEDVAIFAGMTSLQNLHLNAEMTDQAVATLSTFENLQYLGLENCTLVTDRGLVPLKRLKRLADIHLPPGTGDAGLRTIAGIPTLLRVHLPSNCSVTDDGIEALIALPMLTTLSLPVNTSDRSCAAVSKMKELDSLVVSGTQITDKGLRRLASLEKLRHLSLTISVSKEELAVLKTLKSVKYMFLQRSGLTDEDVAELRKAIPGATIQASR